jgi:hypothetical protein
MARPVIRYFFGGKALVPAACAGLILLVTGCGGGGSSSGGPPPPPVSNATLSSISPIVATAGSPGFTLTANGTGFTQTSQVVFNSTPETTSFVTSSQLTATVSAGDIAQASPAGGYPVTVKTGTQTTSAVNFFVVPSVGPRAVSVSGGVTANMLDIGLTADSQSKPLSLLSVGVGSTAGATGGEVSRGTSASLLLAGDGIVPGAFFMITGPGDVTVTQPQATDFTTCNSGGSGGGASTPCVSINISVSATAAPGPRNIIVTNPAGELAVFVGGLLVTKQ